MSSSFDDFLSRKEQTQSIQEQEKEARRQEKIKRAENGRSLAPTNGYNMNASNDNTEATKKLEAAGVLKQVFNIEDAQHLHDDLYYIKERGSIFYCRVSQDGKRIKIRH